MKRFDVTVILTINAFDKEGARKIVHDSLEAIEAACTIVTWSLSQVKHVPKYDASFSCCNEGMHGDYDQDDPDDVKLLRLNVELDGQPMRDGSYCTLVDARTPEHEQVRLLDLVVKMLQASTSVKRTMQQLSWMKGGDTVDSFK